MSMIRETNSKTFSDVYSDADTFVKECNEYGLTQTISDDSKTAIFYLLTAYYGDTELLGYRNETRWKMKLFSIMYQYGALWEKRADVSKSLANMSAEEVQKGYQIMSNHALNPQTAPGTDTDTELTYINEQTVSKNTRGKMDALMLLYDNQKSSYTKDFLDKFKVLFNPILMHSEPLYVYIKEDEE